MLFVLEFKSDTYYLNRIYRNEGLKLKIILIIDTTVLYDVLKDEIEKYRQSSFNIHRLSAKQIMHAWMAETSFVQSGFVVELPFSLSLEELKTIGSIGMHSFAEIQLYSLMGKMRNIVPMGDCYISTELKHNNAFVFKIESHNSVF